MILGVIQTLELWGRVPNDGYAQEYHGTRTSIPIPLPSETLHNGNIIDVDHFIRIGAFLLQIGPQMGV